MKLDDTTEAKRREKLKKIRLKNGANTGTAHERWRWKHQLCKQLLCSGTYINISSFYSIQKQNLYHTDVKSRF